MIRSAYVRTFASFAARFASFAARFASFFEDNFFDFFKPPLDFFTLDFRFLGA
jgi:hypothetical protein